MKKLLGNKKLVNFVEKNWPYILITALGLSVSWPLARYGYFSHQDDLQIIRIFEMRKCFADLQIPCRWVADMGWGNGFPLFNFYGVFPYYFGAVVSLLTGYINSAKILFLFSLIFGSFGIYLLVKSLWGKLAGAASAVLYLFAPYKALDVYVRGALSESLALSIIPFVFYFAYKLVAGNGNKKYGFLFTVFLFVFLITHNIMSILFLPFLAAWIIYWLADTKWKNLKSVIIFGMVGIGLSSFFILPAFFEKNLVQTESLVRFELDFRANYLKINQLFFDRVWGYGTSIPGPEGGMNFQIGWPHWWLAAFSLILLIVSKSKKSTKIMVAGILAAFAISVFMTHNRSTFIWIRVSLLKYFQFPWRFLSLSIFSASILGGFVVSAVKEKGRLYICVLIIVLSVILNWQYFRPKMFYRVNDSEKLSGESWEIQRKGAILDYLPKTALEPREAAPEAPIIRLGKGQITDFVNHSNKWKFNAVIEEKSEIEVPVYYFPNWEVSVNKKEYPSTHDNLLGRISVTLDAGNYLVEGRFKDTPLRTVANVLTLTSVALLISYVLYGKSQKAIK